MFRCVTVQCLTEIASLNVSQMDRREAYMGKVIDMLKLSMLQVFCDLPV